MTRRGAILLTCGALNAQRIAPVDELANTFEMEEMARRKLSPDLFRQIAGSERDAIDRITLRPRMMVNTLEMDLSVELFGQRHFTPILAGPMALQGRFHPEAESATLEGAAQAKAAVILAAKTTQPVGKLKPPYWLQVDPAKRPATDAGVFVVTAPFDWKAVDELRKATKTPLLVKGIMSAGDAKMAIQHGANGIVVSNYRAGGTQGLASPIEVLPAIATEVNRRVPILIDGSFRRGSDILKALALGANAVLIGRPILWGLAAYGARGVHQVIDQLQAEFARDMAMCGVLKCNQLTPGHVRIHRR